MIVDELSDIGRPYPPKGWDFPRRDISITPSEILYEPGRVLGVPARMVSLRHTVLRQPRLETTAVRMEPLGIF